MKVVTINDFLRVSHQLDASITLDNNQQLTTKYGRVVRTLQMQLQRTPIINQLPPLRCQQLKNNKVKNALLLAIAQEYGRDAAKSLSQSPEYCSQDGVLSGRKVIRILQILDHLYHPLKQADRLPRYNVDDLFAANRGALLHSQLKKFLTATDKDQKRYQLQLKHQLQQHRQVADKRIDDPQLKLSSKQGLALYELMCNYQLLPLSRPRSYLPMDYPNTHDSVCTGTNDFSTLPITRQLSIVGSAAASRVGYGHAIDPCTQELLAIKRLAVPRSYYTHALKTQLAASNRRLEFINDHIYSSRGLSAHFIIRANECPERVEKKELSLVFGGFSSHRTFLGNLKQARAILNNLVGAPSTSTLYREAAQLAAQAANYARTHNFNTFTVSGHSLGGGLAEHAMARYSELIDRAVVFQPFHVMGRHREGLKGDRMVLQKITVVTVKHDWITSPLVHRHLKGTQTIELSPRWLGQNVHSKYHRHLFKAVLGNL